jgi:hypothetical protein
MTHGYQQDQPSTLLASPLPRPFRFYLAAGEGCGPPGLSRDSAELAPHYGCQLLSKGNEPGE